MPDPARPAEGERFRDWYARTRGCPYPASDEEPIHVVVERVAEAMADWADHLAQRSGAGPTFITVAMSPERAAEFQRIWYSASPGPLTPIPDYKCQAEKVMEGQE